MRFDYRFSEDLDVDESFLTPTDVKQFIFCPRVVYFTRVMNIRPILGSQQPAAKKEHAHIARLEKQRTTMLRQRFPFTIVERKFEVFLRSERLRVHGRADMLVMTDTNEIIPVEFKTMASNEGHGRLDHKYQLAVIALLVEDNCETIVRRGYLHYIKDEQTVEIVLSEGVKRRAQTYLKRIEEMIRTERVPAPRRECTHERVGCGFADQCRDL